MKIARTSQYSGIERVKDLDITEEQLNNFLRGMYIQEAFPNLNAADREFILTGITDEEWSELFPKEEEE